MFMRQKKIEAAIKEIKNFIEEKFHTFDEFEYCETDYKEGYFPTLNDFRKISLNDYITTRNTHHIIKLNFTTPATTNKIRLYGDYGTTKGWNACSSQGLIYVNGVKLLQFL